jgi:hypothetical protein
MSENDYIAEAQKAWDAGDFNRAAAFVADLRARVAERGATVEQEGNGRVVVKEAG